MLAKKSKRFIMNRAEVTMRKNMTRIDRIIRIIAAFAVAILYLTDRISGFAAFILGLPALILFLSGVSGVCPLYNILRSRSSKKPQ